MPLILHGLTPLHWTVAGLAIAGVTLALLGVASRRLGVSTGFEDICSLVLRTPYFGRSAIRSGRAWRLPLLAGLVLGGFLSATLGGGWSPTWDLGVFDRAVGLGPAGKRPVQRRETVEDQRHRGLIRRPRTRRSSGRPRAPR